MSAVSRKIVRDRIVSHFQTDLTGAGPVESVYGHDRRDFKAGESPVVLVLSEGIARQPHGIGSSKYASFMRFSVLVFVREADESASWTSANVEDALDSVEAAIADSVMSHRQDVGYWTNLMLSGDTSNILPGNVGGKPYKMEIMSLVAEVYDA